MGGNAAVTTFGNASNQDTTDVTTNVKTDLAASDSSAGNNLGNKLNLQNSNGNTLTLSDFGAIDAAERLGRDAIDSASQAASDAQRTAETALSDSFTIAQTKVQGDLVGILKVMGWIGAGVAALIFAPKIVSAFKN